jgi:hypothetical protein
MLFDLRAVRDADVPAIVDTMAHALTP